MKSLRIIDTLTPFFRSSAKQEIINWSKIPFSDMEENGSLKDEKKKQIISDWRKYLKEISKLDYNAISVDDLAHLIDHEFYQEELRLKIKDYKRLYKTLFNIAKEENLQIFINSDYIFQNESIIKHTVSSNVSMEDFFIDTVKKAFKDFPQVNGIILRIGENDGTDVSGDFLSNLELKTPTQANGMLRKLLPIFEQQDKTLIFRTWTVGAYPIGDLIWNPKTFDKVFKSISSDRLIISMKFGHTDFMRHLELNPLFFRGEHKKMIELQTRREWEGMGLMPSFVGWDYEKYLKQLKSAKNIVGIHVWCQTGGWANSLWYNATFLDNISFWSQLNTFVVSRIYHAGESTEKAIEEFCQQNNIKDVRRFIKLLRLLDKAILEGLYIKEIAQKTLYFRRTRLPSLLWIAWDKSLVNDITAYLLKAFVRNKREAIRQGRDAERDSYAAIELAKHLNVPKTVLDSIRFNHATLAILADLREHILTGLDNVRLERFKKHLSKYKTNNPQHYRISEDLPTKHLATYSNLPFPFLRLIIRNKKEYRILDRLMLITSPIQRRVALHYIKKNAPHLASQSMGIDIIFR